MKKVKRVKFKFKNVLIFFFWLAIIIGVCFLLFNKKINNIYVTGNKILTEQEILDIAEFYDYKKFYQINSKKIENNIKKNSYIEDVAIKKTLFSITINVLEYDMLCYQDFNQKVLLSNGNWVSISNKPFNIPVLTNEVDSELIKNFCKKMTLINDDILNKISEISYSPIDLDKERFLLYMNDQNYVYLTLSKFDYINKYSELLPKLEGKKGILYLDSGNHFEIKK